MSPATSPTSCTSPKRVAEFLADLAAFLNEDGWRAQRMAEINLPTWIEDPTPVLMSIKQSLGQGGEFNLDAERARISAGARGGREGGSQPGCAPQQKGWFTTLLHLAQRCGYSARSTTTTSTCTRTLCCAGRRWRSVGGSSPAARSTRLDDVLFLIPDEIRKVAITPDNFDVRPVVAGASRRLGTLAAHPNPPVLLKPGYDMDEAMGVLIGVERLDHAEGGRGFVPGCPARAQGRPLRRVGFARRVRRRRSSRHERAPPHAAAGGGNPGRAGTYPSWTPVFGMIKGVVVDRGASLSHAAIVGREYGIPVVMNVFVGSKEIRTGMRIRVDGDLGALYILDEVPGG